MKQFKHFVVSITNNPNEFYVRVNDLAKSIADFNKPPDDLDNYKFSLRRALFIEQAIEEKISREE